MKRCGIFVFFNEHGIVESYVEILLKSLEEEIDKLIIIINGDIMSDEKLKLYKYSEDVFQRKNVGFDGGAYKDVFTSLLYDEDWKQWDEILLINDTFYGPFFSWDETFSVMQERKCDFWGLSSHPGGVEPFFNGEIVAPHVQSYFIVIKKRMFSNDLFYKFWKELIYPTNFKEAVKYFEIHFTEYFSKLGFRYESWIEVQKERSAINSFQYIDDMETRIIKLHFPVFKRKMYRLQNYLSLKRIFQYIDMYTKYPLEAIQQDIYQRCIEEKVKPYNPEKIKKFCGQYNEIYLFGMGGYAKNIEQYLIDNGIYVCGYIVSKKKIGLNRLFELKDFEIKDWQGIIVALNQKNLREVSGEIIRRIPKKQCMFPLF